jgi:hypothetical protein
VLPRRPEQVAIDDAGPLPRLVARRRLGGDEPPDAVPEQLVLVLEQGAPHVADRTLAA